MPYVFKSDDETRRVRVPGLHEDHDFSSGNLETEDPRVAATLRAIDGLEQIEEPDSAQVQEEQRPEVVAERNERILAARAKSEHPEDDAYTYAKTGEEAIGADLQVSPSEEHDTLPEGSDAPEGEQEDGSAGDAPASPDRPDFLEGND